MSRGTTPPTHYTILNLPCPPVPLRKTELKLAYHQALLKYHPDKSTSPKTCNSATVKRSVSGASAAKCPNGKGNWPQTYTIDQVTTAYKILADPVAKAEYDRALRLDGLGKKGGRLNLGTNNADEDDTIFRTGLEAFDLDEMEIEILSDFGNGGSRIWYHSCRCGADKGFSIREEDLEREAECGEVVVGCVGCSLWARVMFSVDDGRELEDEKEE